MAKSAATILIVDDDEFVLLSIRVLLEPHFSTVLTSNTPERIPALLRQSQVDVMLLDMNFRQGDTTSKEGLFWLRRVHSDFPEVQMILMTAYADVQIAVEAMKEGALDFVIKPWENEKLLATVRTASLVSVEKKRVKQLKVQQKGIIAAFDKKYEPMIGSSTLIEEIRKTISKVAPTPANILITGENGTGKEVIAREIHRHSDRSENIFMSVDLGSLTESLFESELFGHKKGAFTDAKDDRVGRIEAANGGTLFLDEIGNITLTQQAKLLSFLQLQQITRVGSTEIINVDVRIICATNGDLRAMVKEGKFREDLLYRINTVEIHVPPLYERATDIPLLIDHFLSRYRTKYMKPELEVDKSIYDPLMKYRWPGNIRELQHAVERAVIMCEDDQLTMESFGNLQQNFSADAIFEYLNLEKLEAWAIRKAIAKHQGNISHAAEELGLSRGAIYRRLEKYGI